MNSLQNRSTLLDKQYDTGQFSACIVTNIGKEMIAKSQNGQTLTFTRVALGDGLIDDDDDILSFTKVKNERLSANIAKWVDKQNGQFQIQFRVSNQEVEIGFWQREIGIMAKIDGGEEQLYAYATSGNGADFLYDKTTPIDERIVNIDFVIGNAENVQVIVNGSIIYATIEDLENAIDEHNADENAHDNLIKRLFGSAEATLDSIKLNIKEWAKEVCLPLSGGIMKGNINASGYNITATKFIGNLQGNADSADKLGTSTVGSATKPVYINNGVASAVSVDLSTLAPKASPGLTGIPTAPTPDTDDDSTKIATTAFIQNLLTSKFELLGEKNGWWREKNTGLIMQWCSENNFWDLNYSLETHPDDIATLNFPITFNNILTVIPLVFTGQKTMSFCYGVKEFNNSMVKIQFQETVSTQQKVKVGCLAIGV